MTSGPGHTSQEGVGNGGIQKVEEFGNESAVGG